MNFETREALLDALDDAFRSVGSEGYEAGIVQLKGWTERFLKVVTTLDTREKAAAVFDSMNDPTDEQKAIALAMFLPKLLALGVVELASKFQEEMGVKGGGRNPVRNEQLVEIVQFMGSLVMQGATITSAKIRASQRFGISKRTAERAWQNRAQILEGKRPLSFKEAKEWFLSVLRSDIPLLPETSGKSESIPDSHD